MIISSRETEEELGGCWERRERENERARATRDPRNTNRDDCHRWNRLGRRKKEKEEIFVKRYTICFQPLLCGNDKIREIFTKSTLSCNINPNF